MKRNLNNCWMNWMNLKGRVTRAALILLMTAGMALPAAGQQDAFGDLKQKFEEGTIFRAMFTHSYADSFTGDTTSDSGEIWVGRQEYRVQTRRQTVVVDGTTSMVYDEDRGRVIISTYEPEEDDFAPSRILNGIDSTFIVSDQERRGEHIYIHLHSDDNFALYQEVEIWLEESLIPVRIRALDPADNVIITEFSEGRFTVHEEGMFRLEYPDTAEIVDMRN